ncbi:MAG: DUF1800 domain-containing protein [Chloroflexaceae bacterium]|nr:DUF1800 domain-containing protein [Chloroflexaceae bacterium]
MLHRWRICNNLTEDSTRDDRPYFVVDIVAQTPETTPTRMIDYWINRILGRPMNPAEREMLIEFLAQGRNPDLDLPSNLRRDWLPRAVALILMSPDFNWR